MKSTDDHKNGGLVSTSSSSSILVLPSNFLDVTTSLLELSDLVFCWVHVAHPAQWITSVEQLHFCRGDEHWKGPLYTAHAQQTCTQDKQCNTVVNCLGRSQQLTGFPHISTGAFRASALGEQAVPPGQLPLHQHHGHTQTCKEPTRTGEWAIIKLQTLGLDLHIFVCRYIHDMHAGSGSAFVHVCAGRCHAFAWAGQGSFLCLSFSLHWMGKGCQQFPSVNSWEMLFCS